MRVVVNYTVVSQARLSHGESLSGVSEKGGGRGVGGQGGRGPVPPPLAWSKKKFVLASRSSIYLVALANQAPLLSA